MDTLSIAVTAVDILVYNLGQDKARWVIVEGFEASWEGFQSGNFYVTEVTLPMVKQVGAYQLCA